MMNLIFFRILFFCLIPIGIFILVKTIRLLKGVFNGNIIAEIPFAEKVITFTIYGSGVFAIWQKGNLFKRTPVDKFELKLYNEQSGAEVALSPSIFRPYINNFDTGRMELNRFSAEAGMYRLTVNEGTSVSLFEKVFLSLFPSGKIDYSEYYIQVRESKPVYYIIAAIPLFTLCGFCMIGGFVAGFIAPQILNNLGIQYIP